MKKTFTKMFLLGAAMAFGVNVASAETTTAGVKMTYVNYDEPDKSYGEIPTGETAEAGYNKISNGQVEFVNTGWKVNYITYLQVDASAVDGNIIRATLSFDASGSTDNKRTTEWGLGYNSSVWSSDMTYNTADKSITTFGSTLMTTSKSASTFNKLTFDIADAIKASENGIITILVYETAAGGGYIKNPVVEVEWTNAAAYSVTFTETNGVKAEVTVNGRNVTDGVTLEDGTYKFTATATGYEDYNGEFTVNGANLKVEYTMTANPNVNYTLTGVDKDGANLGVVNSGEAPGGSILEVGYPEYLLNNNNFYKSVATDKVFAKKITLGFSDTNENVTYTLTDIQNVVVYVEGEDLEGATKSDYPNATARTSKAGCGWSKDNDLVITNLPAGKYKMTAGFFYPKKAGNTNTFNFAAGDNVNFGITIEGNGGNNAIVGTSEEFIIEVPTDLVFKPTGYRDMCLDYAYIVKTGDVEAEVKVTSITLDKTMIEAEEGAKVQLNVTYEPTNATNTDFVWSSSNENIATVSQTGLVSILKTGECVITVATADGSVKAECSVSVQSAVTEIESEKAGEMVIYNLMGQRVKNPTKGIYIINGKKVLVK